MGRSKRIRRTLAIRVSEPLVTGSGWTETPGQRFATGWALFQRSSAVMGDVSECRGDAVAIAGFLAAKAAWDAHHHAVNWLAQEVAA